LIHSPELAERVQKLGEYLRFETTFSASLTEIGVLLVARKYRSANVWHAHRALALKTGSEPCVIAYVLTSAIPLSVSGKKLGSFG
jgi:4-carboxymuconolactone decarboxylase